VTSNDVVHGKPDPEGYVKTLEILDADPARAIVFEDTEAGVASARAAGVGRVLAMRTTLEPHRLAEADELIDRLDLAVMRRLLT
jgi:sugar-phosphatase